MYLINKALNINSNLFEAFDLLTKNGEKICFIIDDDNKLKGVLTDGDARRAILEKKILDLKVQDIMNTDFIFVNFRDKKKGYNLLIKNNISHIPVLDDSEKIIDVLSQQKKIDKSLIINTAVIMAGGKGKRLRPITKNCPKPMVKIKGKPLLEILISNLNKEGIEKFYISVNYLKSQIIDYFGSGEKLGVEIEYLFEDEPLGTAGSLSLLPQDIFSPFLVINGDVLSKVNLKSLSKFHFNKKSIATVCVKDHKIKIPFGVIKSEGSFLSKFLEKPKFSYLINAGIYIIEPEILDFLKPNLYMDMPTLLDMANSGSNRIALFPIFEDWVDVGRPETLELAKKNRWFN